MSEALEKLRLALIQCRHKYSFGWLKLLDVIEADLAAKDAEIDELKTQVKEYEEFVEAHAIKYEDYMRLKAGWMAAECDAIRGTRKPAACPRGVCTHTRQGTDYCQAVRDVVKGGK